jgi:hypothetical protein
MESESFKIHDLSSVVVRQLPIIGFAHKTAVVGDGGVPCSIRSSRRSESTSDTFSATTSETRRPAA